MSIKLLPASVDPVEPSDASTGLVPLTQRRIATQGSKTALVPAAAFAWSSSTRQSAANVIHGTPVEDSDIGETEVLSAEYVSGWTWNFPIESTAIAQYLFYAASLAAWSGRLINVYA